MNLNFELILFYAVIISGLIALLDIFFLAPRRRPVAVQLTKDSGLPWYSDYARSFFPILLIVFLLRSFLYEPFRIPTGSLEPTLLVGDFILVNKFDYGLRLPVLHKKIFSTGEPKRGDIMVFRWPPNPSVDYIKRVVGVPGDRISYIDKVLYINGKKAPQVFQKNAESADDRGMTLQVTQMQENLLGVKHSIYTEPNRLNDNFRDLIVPEGMYFMMGDNRDNSADSRYWGFVSEKNIIGKAVYVWLSWDKQKYALRWQRMNRLII